MKTLATILILLGFSLPSFGADEEPKSIQELETEEFLLDGSLWERIEREARRKSIQCMRAFPSEEFCSCLGNELPMIVTMAHYTLAVTLSKEELGYDEVTEEQREAIDSTLQARETCAARISQ